MLGVNCELISLYYGGVTSVANAGVCKTTFKKSTTHYQRPVLLMAWRFHVQEEN